MNFSADIAGEFLISSVIKRDWLEVLWLLMHEMLVCQEPLPHFWRSTFGELFWSWEVHKNYIIIHIIHIYYHIHKFKLFVVQMLQTCCHIHTSLSNFFYKIYLICYWHQSLPNVLYWRCSSVFSKDYLNFSS